jgi:hypothetical protein
MKYSLNGRQRVSMVHMYCISKHVGLVGHIKTHFPAMYRLYLILKDRTDPPTDEEIAIASGEKVLDADAIDTYLGHVDIASSNLRSMFVKQTQANVVRILFSDVVIID